VADHLEVRARTAATTKTTITTTGDEAATVPTNRHRPVDPHRNNVASRNQILDEGRVVHHLDITA
jgi:hypothetical protein